MGSEGHGEELDGLDLRERAAPDARGEGPIVGLSVHARPGAKRSTVVGARAAALAVQLAAPPVDGAANAELVRLVASVLGVPRSAVTVVRGARSRDKVVEVHGLTAATLRARLTEALRGGPASQGR